MSIGIGCHSNTAIVNLSVYFFQNDKISVFNPCFIDNFFKWHTICHQYVITPNVSLNLV